MHVGGWLSKQGRALSLQEAAQTLEDWPQAGSGIFLDTAVASLRRSPGRLKLGTVNAQTLALTIPGP